MTLADDTKRRWLQDAGIPGPGEDEDAVNDVTGSMSEPQTATEAEALDAVRNAHQRLADIYHDREHRHHVNVHIYRMGLACSACGGAWDGFFEDDDIRVCRECGGRFIRWVTEATR